MRETEDDRLRRMMMEQQGTAPTVSKGPSKAQQSIMSSIAAGSGAEALGKGLRHQVNKRRLGR